METTLLLYLTLFILYLIPQAMIINGIFLAATGYTEVKPDGTDHDSEMIFYPLAKYLNQKSMERVYFFGGEYNKTITTIIERFPTLEDPAFNHPISEDQTLMWLKQKQLIEKSLDIKIGISGGTVKLWREYSVYKFSKYIRKPIFGCVICMSSFWSVFTFLIPVFLLFKDPIVIALYMPNAFCLAYLNWKIYKPL